LSPLQQLKLQKTLNVQHRLRGLGLVDAGMDNCGQASPALFVFAVGAKQVRQKDAGGKKINRERWSTRRSLFELSSVISLVKNPFR
jgi:hypothetical protein